MKKAFKRITAALLVAVMLFGSAPIESLTGIDFGALFNLKASAANFEEIYINDLTYDIKNWKTYNALRMGEISNGKEGGELYYYFTIYKEGKSKTSKNIEYRVKIKYDTLIKPCKNDYTQLNEELTNAANKSDGTSTTTIRYAYKKSTSTKQTSHHLTGLISTPYIEYIYTLYIAWLDFSVNPGMGELTLNCHKNGHVKLIIRDRKNLEFISPRIVIERYRTNLSVPPMVEIPTIKPQFTLGIVDAGKGWSYLDSYYLCGKGVSTEKSEIFNSAQDTAKFFSVTKSILKGLCKKDLKLSDVAELFQLATGSEPIAVVLDGSDSSDFEKSKMHPISKNSNLVYGCVITCPKELKVCEDFFQIEVKLDNANENEPMVRDQKYVVNFTTTDDPNYAKPVNSANYKADIGGDSPTYSNYVKFSGLKHSDVQGKSVKIEGKIDNVNGQKVNSHGIYLKKDSNYLTGNDIKWSSNNAKTSSTISVAETLKGLEPNTKYYYAIYANTDYGHYCSEIKSFKTPKVKPENTSIASVKTIDYRTNKEINSSELGVGDTVKIKWNAAKYAEWYTIKVNGIEDKTKIYGTEKILKLDTVGTNTISICAHNEVGSSAWTAEKTATVHEDVTLSFVIPDNEGNNNEFESHTLTWNHDLPSMPAAPSRIGSTFSGWYKEGEDTHANVKNIKEDTTLYARYVVNVYTVKFADNKGNDIEVTLADGTKTKEQKVKYGEAAVPPAESDVPVPDGYRFLGWNADYSYINTSMTIKAVVDNANYAQPIHITSAEAMRYDGRYEVVCTVNNKTLEHTQGRIVVALKTDAGHLITTTESTVYFVEKNDPNQDITSTDIQKSVELKVLIPVDEIMDSKGLIADYVEIYAVENFKSTVPVAEHYTVRVQDYDEWSAWQTVNPEGQEGVGEIDSKTQYRYRDKMTTTVNTTTERSELVANGWTYYQQTGPEVVTGSWSETKPEALEYRVINEKTVTDYKTVKKYCYKRYSYQNNGTWWSYGSTWATNNGYSGKWEYKLTDKPLSEYKSFDGKMAYGSASDFWWAADVNTKQGTDYTTATTNVKVKSGSHKEYQAVDSIYTYYLEKWPETFSDWQDTEVELKSDETNEVETQQVYRYKTDLPKRSSTDTTNIREDFCTGNLGIEYAGKQVTLFIYKVTEASDWTTEYVAQTVIDSDGNYFFDPYILREEPSEITGDFTVTLGIEGADSAIYLGKIEAPDPVYTVTYYDGITGEKIPISFEKDENYKYYYKRYKYEYNGTTYYSYSQSSADSLGLTGTWLYKITTEPLEKTGTTNGVSVYEGWYRADSNLTEGTRYTVYQEYVDSTTIYTYDQSVTEHGDALPPEPPVHEGYTFSHWDMRSTDIIGDTVINAIYDPIEFTVVYYDSMNAEEPVKIETYGYNAEFMPPEAFDTAELKFVGWDKVIDGVTNVKEDMIITALYEPITYEVTFNGIDDSGEALSVQEIEYGDSPVVPELEVPEDIIFFGWQAEGDETLTEVEMLSITENTQLYPQYMFVNTTETPVANIESGSYSSAQTVKLSCETENADIYYTTDGTDPMMSETALEYDDATGITISDTCQLRFIATAFNMNVSQEATALYAINDGDEADKFLLNLEVPEWGTTAYSGIVDGGMVLADGIPEYYGYTVAGAYLAYEFNEETEALIFSEPWNIATDTITEDQTIYLDYNANAYTVEFVDYDGIILSEESVLYLSSAVEPAAPSREGYIFTGWDTDEYAAVTENLTVNAVYVPEDEYVTIDLNRSSYTMMSGNSYTLTATTGGNVENPEIVWASSDENVAVVDDNGVVTATGKGSAEIYAIIVDNGETATCKINVVGNPSDELTLMSNSFLTADDYGYIRGFTVVTDEDTQIHHAETVAEVKAHFANNDLVFVDIDGNELADDDYVGTGTIIRLMNGEDLLDAVTVVVSGDMDGDGYVTNRDASRISRYLVDKEAPTEVQIAAMDVNADGYVNNRDASLVSRYLVGKEAL